VASIELDHVTKVYPGGVPAMNNALHDRLGVTTIHVTHDQIDRQAAGDRK
jgi:hypothetical protein